MNRNYMTEIVSRVLEVRVWHLPLRENGMYDSAYARNHFFNGQSRGFKLSEDLSVKSKHIKRFLMVLYFAEHGHYIVHIILRIPES